MSDQLYSIKESTLTDIGDALRRRHGETRMETILVDEVVTVDIFASDNMTDFGVFTGDYMCGRGESYYATYIIDNDLGPTKIKYYNSINFEIFDLDKTGSIFLSSTTSSNPIQDEITINANNFRLELRSGFVSNTNQGYYIEVYKLDADGNHINSTTIQVEKEVEVTNTYRSSEMAQAIDDIETGVILPEEAFVVNGDCRYKFANGGWDWFIEMFGDQVTTSNISNASNMFYGCNLKEIPFDINVVSLPSTALQKLLSNIFLASNIENPPKIYLYANSQDNTKHKVFIDVMFSGNETLTLDEQFIFKQDDYVTINGVVYNFFTNFKKIEQEPTWLFDMIDYDATNASTSEFGGPFPTNWNNCYKIKAIPSLPKFWNDATGYYNTYSYLSFQNCYCLKEITLPRAGIGERSGGSLGKSVFDNCYTIKHIKFDTQEDGTPYVANWKNYTIDLSGAGCNASAQMTASLGYEKRVTDEESYQRLKNDPEYYVGPLASGMNTYGYSGYNHDSAVETINTLFDTSAYGTNTIKFKGYSGEYTDAGAINTLTADEIAIATSRGWTVSFV